MNNPINVLYSFHEGQKPEFCIIIVRPMKKYVKTVKIRCVDNHGYKSSLEIRKLYEVLTDRVAEKHHQIRIIDESGEDYLYPEKFFAPVHLPNITKERLELVTA